MFQVNNYSSQKILQNKVISENTASLWISKLVNKLPRNGYYIYTWSYENRVGKP